MFCIRCGAETAAAEGLCARCFMLTRTLFEIREPKLSYCDSCGMFVSGKEMVAAKDLEAFLARAVVSDYHIEKVRATAAHSGGIIRAHFRVGVRVRGIRHFLTGETDAMFRVRTRKCPNCVKKLGRYHEAIIQVRGSEQDRIINRLTKRLSERAIAAIDRRKEGYDVRIISKIDAAHAVADLRGRYDVTTSSTLVGQKKGKKLYRSVYAVR